MSTTSTLALKAGLRALHYSGIARAMAPAMRGMGAVFMLHHVSPAKPVAYAPNSLLQITPDFLDEVVREVQRQGFDTITLDEARARIRGDVKSDRPFACFTFDDGYRDNRDHALPVMKRHGVPFTVYVASDFADGRGFLWWLVLERVIGRRQSIAATINGRRETFRCISDSDKNATLSLQEFQALWLKARHEEMVREFQEFDRDGNAQVSLDEYKAPVAQMVMRMDRDAARQLRQIRILASR